MSSHRNRVRTACFVGIAVFAMSCQVMPPGLTSIADEFGLGRFGRGLLFATQYAGFFITCMIGGWLSDHFGRKQFLAGGFYLAALGLAAAPLADTCAAFAAAIFCIGCGGGLCEGQISVLLSDLHPERPGQMLNFSQIFYNVGAIAMPVAVGIMLRAEMGWRPGYFVGAALALACGVWFHMLRTPPHHGGHGQGGRPNPAANGGAGVVVAVLAVSMFAYVGAEMTLGNWTPNFFEETFGASKGGAAYVLSGFWAGMLLGRIVYVAVVEKCHYLALILASSILAALGATIAVVSSGFWVAAAAIPFTGFALGGMWATIVAYSSRLFPRRSGLVIGIVMSSGSAGLIVFPPLCGLIASRPSWGLRAGMSQTVLLLLVIAALAVWLWRRERRSGAAQDPPFAP